LFFRHSSGEVLTRNPMKTFYFIAFLHYPKRAATIFYNNATRIQFPESEFLAKKDACDSSG